MKYFPQCEIAFQDSFKLFSTVVFFLNTQFTNIYVFVVCLHKKKSTFNLALLLHQPRQAKKVFSRQLFYGTRLDIENIFHKQIITSSIETISMACSTNCDLKHLKKRILRYSVVGTHMIVTTPPLNKKLFSCIDHTRLILVLYFNRHI